ncbi:MAG: hypothetical protein R3F11_19085 [Verrucomicrobiales bacterium]
MSDPQKATTCATCGSSVDPTAFAGSCPTCLLAGLSLDGGDDAALRQRQHPAAAAAAAAPFLAPTVEELGEALPEYEVFEMIGRGGMGAVYRARDVELDRRSPSN